jgi:hypothetical protein
MTKGNIGNRGIHKTLAFLFEHDNACVGFCGKIEIERERRFLWEKQKIVNNASFLADKYHAGRRAK